MNHARRTALLVTIALASVALVGCTPERAEPEVRVQQVLIEKPVACVPDNLGDEPSYPDTDAALAGAPNFATRYALLWAGRLLRSARSAEVEPVISTCREAAQ